MSSTRVKGTQIDIQNCHGELTNALALVAGSSSKCATSVWALNVCNSNSNSNHRNYKLVRPSQKLLVANWVSSATDETWACFCATKSTTSRVDSIQKTEPKKSQTRNGRTTAEGVWKRSKEFNWICSYFRQLNRFQILTCSHLFGYSNTQKLFDRPSICKSFCFFLARMALNFTHTYTKCNSQNVQRRKKRSSTSATGSAQVSLMRAAAFWVLSFSMALFVGCIDSSGRLLRKETHRTTLLTGTHTYKSHLAQELKGLWLGQGRRKKYTHFRFHLP